MRRGENAFTPSEIDVVLTFPFCEINSFLPLKALWTVQGEDNPFLFAGWNNFPEEIILALSQQLNENGENIAETVPAGLLQLTIPSFIIAIETALCRSASLLFFSKENWNWLPGVTPRKLTGANYENGRGENFECGTRGKCRAQTRNGVLEKWAQFIGPVKRLDSYFPGHLARSWNISGKSPEKVASKISNGTLS